jgi:hypothetical protein
MTIFFVLPTSGLPECRITEEGAEYQGFISHTRGVQRCANWNERPQWKAAYPKLERNYCRNPDRRAAPWCFIDNINKTMWDYCDIPFCKRKFCGILVQWY